MAKPSNRRILRDISKVPKLAEQGANPANEDAVPTGVGTSGEFDTRRPRGWFTSACCGVRLGWPADLGARGLLQDDSEGMLWEKLVILSGPRPRCDPSPGTTPCRSSAGPPSELLICRPVMLAMAMRLQGYEKASDADAVDHLPAMFAGRWS